VGKVFEGIDERLASFLEAQPVFFVSTAPLASDGLVNCSPKRNRREFAVLSADQVGYLDQTGSGVETIAHLRENGRIVVMFCAFDGPPRIVRLHGRGHSVAAGTSGFDSLAPRFEGSGEAGVRAIVVVDVARVSDSCGYGVPIMPFESHRPTMDQWSARKERAGVLEYQAEKNRTSLDGLAALAAPGAEE